MFNPSPRYVTVTEAIALTRSHAHLRLSRRTFDRLLFSGQAPAPVARIKGVSLWDRGDITDWARTHLKSLLEDEARSLMGRPHRDVHSDAPPQFLSITLDEHLSTHAAVTKAEIELLEQRRTLQRRRLWISTHADRTSTPSPSTGVVRERLQARRRRDAENFAAEALAFITEHERLVEADLAKCRGWLLDLYLWAEHASTQRQRRVLDELDLEEEELARREIMGMVRWYDTAADFAAEDPRRALTDPDVADASTPVRLDGQDFGFYWRLDDTDASFLDPRTNGSWRLSWIYSSAELYAFDRATGRVALIGMVPGTLTDMITWLDPLHACHRERNSLALIVKSYQDRAQAGFPDFQRTDLPRIGEAEPLE